MSLQTLSAPCKERHNASNSEIDATRSRAARTTHQVRDEDLVPVLKGHVRVRDFRGERDDWGIRELEAVGLGGHDLAVARVVLQT